MARKMENLIGFEKGYIEVLGYHSKKGKNHYWVCKCKCGKVINLPTGRITNDYMPSCGCYRKQKTKEMPRYSKKTLTDETLIALTRNEGELLLEKTLKLKYGQAKEIYNNWRRDYIYNGGIGIHKILEDYFKNQKEG